MAEVRRWRTVVQNTATETGANVVASGTSPLPAEPEIVDAPRYRELAKRLKLTASEQLVCAFHVHVSVDSDEEGVAVLDRIRDWLPVLLALSANSPFWQGRDTGYSSYRSLMMGRWPGTGPLDVLGSAAEYRRLVDAMLDTGVVMDEAMVYFDARLSHHQPTVEIRIADVCADADDAALIAALCRALVDTAAAQWRAGEPPIGTSTSLLRLANWQAARHGLDNDLLDPRTAVPRPAEEVADVLFDQVRASLHAADDDEWVQKRLSRLLRNGNGAQRQRTVFDRTGDLGQVMTDLAAVTLGHAS